ncbi:alpha/beta hydrolase [Paracidobacterium acidisoli]|uniref:Alpha/beta hydrolase n=1 Tax=Paracidobacterium acidisoli TaxID=2303751 RepID=A0A372IQR2_9BACT|nr:alpha/beta hydrolase [Paracidobacterium acidisoli]MBT9331459.1 alpha/beta hydrolase [Paracidobacterium acidisoli]
MPLDAKVRSILDAQAAKHARPLTRITPEEARGRVEEIVAAVRLTDLPQVRVADINIPGPGGAIPARVYRPEKQGVFPAVVHFHGGGWVMGTLDSHDPFCRYLCGAADAVVVSVDYRLAPEHRFPAAVEDSEAAVLYVLDHAAEFSADPHAVLVSGDSAGGNLAAVVALRLRGRKKLRGQILLFPITDHYSSAYPSYEENAKGYGLERDGMIWFWNHYLPHPQEIHHPDASPLRAADLSGLPPALVVTGEYDVLRDEGVKYAERLKEAGVPVTHLHYDDMHHNFCVWPLTVGALKQSREAIAAMAEWIQAAAR